MELKRKRVIVGISGGVDSAVTALLLKSQGYDVIGIALNLCEINFFSQHIQEAATFAQIPLYIIDGQTLFSRYVSTAFEKSYKKGLTPLPCAICNRYVKFEMLFQIMRCFEADFFATGHYSLKISHNNHYEVLRAVDPVKDQSFFLFLLSSKQLKSVLFPLGNLFKSQVTAYAKDLSFPPRKESQNLCFMKNKNLQQKHLIKKWKIINEKGNFLGYQQHAFYTIGQRKGIGIGGRTEPLYVLKVNSELCQITVGPKESLAQKSVSFVRCNWIAMDLINPFSSEHHFDVEVKIRSTTRPQKAKLTLNTTSWSGKILLDKKEYGVAPGQACVIYQGARLLGGGWIID